MSKKSLVKFVRAHGAYVKGDVAGFEVEHAERLVDAGHAETYTAPKGDVEAKSSQTGPGKK